jgi:hypothetical protein
VAVLTALWGFLQPLFGDLIKALFGELVFKNKTKIEERTTYAGMERPPDVAIGVGAVLDPLPPLV